MRGIPQSTKANSFEEGSVELRDLLDRDQKKLSRDLRVKGSELLSNMFLCAYSLQQDYKQRFCEKSNLNPDQ